MIKNTCDITCVHPTLVKKGQEQLAKLDKQNMTHLFKALSEENRLKILYILSIHDVLCVCDIAQTIDATVANTSHHLQTLKKMGLINSKREGKLVYYFSTEPLIAELIQTSINHQEVTP